MDDPATNAREAIERLNAEAASLPRGSLRLATLRRLEEAANDIASGRARSLAEKADRDPGRFGPLRFPKINSETVQHYVRIRERLDTLAGKLNSEWTGPHASTIRKDKALLLYLRNREAAARGYRRVKAQAARETSLEDIVATIPKTTDQATLQFALDRLRNEAARYDILYRAVRDMPGVNLDALLGRTGSASEAAKPETLSVLGPGEKIVLRGLLNRLSDSATLADFGLRTDGRRVAMIDGPGTALIEKVELELLKALAGAPV